MNELDLKKLDLKHVWHPFTQQAVWAQEAPAGMHVVRKAKGVYLYGEKKHRYIDGVSSLWANIYGHQNAALDSALKRQLGKMAHTTFLGLTHEPGILLAARLAREMPPSLTRAFYSDNGSTAVEVALKMAYQYYAQKRIPGRRALGSLRKNSRVEFFALKNAYHGDTVGAMSVGGIGLFHGKFKKLFFKTHFAMSPDCLRCPFRKTPAENIKNVRYAYKGENPRPGQFRKITGCRWECLGQVEKVLRAKNKRLAAAIVEPLLQGAGGMIVMPSGYLKGFAALCKKYGVLLIADEIATGFGRTGQTFACRHEGVTPDFVCLSKGITGGYLPLAVTMTSEKIYRAFLGRADEFKTFFHGHTYTANPLACALALAGLDLQNAPGFIPGIQEKADFLQSELKMLENLPHVGQIRQIGLVAGIELFQNPSELKSCDYGLQLGREVCRQALRRGVWMRPLADTIILMPPLVISKPEIRKFVRAVKESIQAACALLLDQKK